MTPSKVEKCSHPACKCAATTGKYCSTECAGMEKTPHSDCHCGHQDCQVRAR
jgi:hypothetical protein